MQGLLGAQELRDSCPVPFDEGRLWKGEEGPALKAQLQAGFRNITRVMDCVGCEKCKLWGKLQTLGIATALKVLFTEADCDGGSPPAGQRLSDLRLERNEVRYPRPGSALLCVRAPLPHLAVSCYAMCCTQLLM